tara:strand:+ start:214 stop:606 length:393 start_codon:yes stop_codon:yes gene_type:complete
MHKIFLILLFLFFTSNASSQEGTLFDYQIQKLEDSKYQIQLQLHVFENVQFIQIQFFDGTHELQTYQASLNRKKDGKFYLFFNNDETIVNLEAIELQIMNNFGYLKAPSVKINLVDKDFNKIDSYQQIID